MAGGYLRQTQNLWAVLLVGVPILLNHNYSAMRRHLTDFLTLIELIMTSFNVKRTAERYFNNLIIQMKDGGPKRLMFLLPVTT